MSYWRGKRAVVTGGSAGLGRALANALVSHGANVAIVARGQQALDATVQELKARGGNVLAIAADVTSQPDVDRLSSTVISAWGGLDLLCHCAGRSMRGTALATSVDEFRELLETNFLSAVRCTQAFAAALDRNRAGTSCSSVRWPAKWRPDTWAPIRPASFRSRRLPSNCAWKWAARACTRCWFARDPSPATAATMAARDTLEQAPDVPAAAHQPAGGAKVRAIDPRWLAEKILRACEQRRAELIVPRRARLLFAVSQLSPRFGDWLLRKMTTE